MVFLGMVYGPSCRRLFATRASPAPTTGMTRIDSCARTARPCSWLQLALHYVHAPRWRAALLHCPFAMQGWSCSLVSDCASCTWLQTMPQGMMGEHLPRSAHLDNSREVGEL